MKKTILLVLFTIICLAQIAIISNLVYSGINKGTVINLKCGLYDPYDVLKGRYLNLIFFMEDQKFSDFPASLKKEITDSKTKDLYCVLSDDFSRITKIYTHKPAGEPLFIKIKLVDTNYYDKFKIEFPFNKYYMQEDLAPKADNAIRQKFKEINPQLFISVDKNGNTRTVKLEVMGMPIEKYLKGK